MSPDKKAFVDAVRMIFHAELGQLLRPADEDLQRYWATRIEKVLSDENDDAAAAGSVSRAARSGE